MDSLFKQAGGIGCNWRSTYCGLTGEFRLNLGSDVNGDGHGHPPRPNLPPPPFEVKETAPRDTTVFDLVSQVTDAWGQVSPIVRLTDVVRYDNMNYVPCELTDGR